MYSDLTGTPIDDLKPKSVEAIQKLAATHHFDDLASVQPTLSKISSNALVVQKNQYTMFSFASNESEGFVIDANPDTISLVLDFLTTTESSVIVHNALFDIRKINWETKKHVKNVIDTQLIWATILNHVDTFNAKVGLKGLAGKIYGKWAVTDDLFGIENKYNPDLIEYAGIDAIATYFLYQDALHHPEFQWLPGESKIPIDQVLPIHHPSDLAHRQSRRFFYENVVTPLIKPMITMMNNGITLDMDKVYSLDKQLDEILSTVETNLLANEYIQAFNQHRYKQFHSAYITDRKSKMRQINSYLKPIDLSKMDHRSYLMEQLRSKYPFDFTPPEQLPDGQVKWSAADVKKLTSILIPSHPLHLLIPSILDKTLNDDNCTEAMIALATQKATKYNESYLQDIENVSIADLPKFNPGSSTLKQQLFEYLKVPCEDTTDKGADSWSRSELERVLTESTDPTLTNLLESLIAFSQGAIIKQNFVKGFINYSIDGILYPSHKLWGTKTFRPTSGGKGSINFLNTPATGSIYSKLIKSCFAAKEGRIMCASDFSSLQEVTGANVTNDENKIKILQGYDSHCFHAPYYFPRIEEILGKNDGSIEWNKKFKAECNTNDELKDLRQASKPISFKLAFGGMPDIDRGGKITETIYYKYHNELYPGVNSYNTNVVMKEATSTNQVYMGLGAYIKTNNPNKDGRTLCNSTWQFWDLISLIAIALFQERIDKANMNNQVKIVNTIYDAIYLDVDKTPEAIQWVNTNLIEVMTIPLFHDQKVPNAAALDVGPDIAHMEELKNTATITDILTILSKGA